MVALAWRGVISFFVGVQYEVSSVTYAVGPKVPDVLGFFVGVYFFLLLFND